MKKLFIAALFAAGIGSALVSCNNGNYDADPKTDNSSVKNPLTGDVVYLGTIKGEVNGKQVIFDNVSYKIDTTNTRIITGTLMNDPVFFADLEIFFAESSYKGPNVYNIGGDAAGWEFIYAYKDTSYHNRNVRKTYWAGHPGIGKGNITFHVLGDEGGNLRGWFDGTVYRATIDQDYLFTGSYDKNDTVVFKNCNFYIPKK
jgi:hypothetical protein